MTLAQVLCLALLASTSSVRSFPGSAIVRQVPTKGIVSRMDPPVLMYNKTARLVFHLGQPVCQRDKFMMTQVNELTDTVTIWRSGMPTDDSKRLFFYNDTTFVIPRASFQEWGNYSAQCTAASSFFSYFPSPLSVPVAVNPWIFGVNFSRLVDEVKPTTTPLPQPDENGTWPDPVYPDPIDEYAETYFEYPVPLSEQVERWLLKFDVGNGYYPKGERGFFNLSGLERLQNLQFRGSQTTEPFDVPYKDYPDGTTYRQTFDMSIEMAATQLPSVCDFPLNATVSMKSNVTASQHTFNVTLRLEYKAQMPSTSARLERETCILRCDIKSACPLLDNLLLKVEGSSSGFFLPSVSSEQSTFVEAKLTSQDCTRVVEMYKNNTGTLKCVATNQVEVVTYEVPLRNVPGIGNLDMWVTEIAGSHWPFWAKIVTPVACLLVLILFISVIVLCVQKCKIAREKNRRSADFHALATASSQNQLNDQALQQQQRLQQPPQQAPESVSLISSTQQSAMASPAHIGYANVPPTRRGDYHGPASTKGQAYMMPPVNTSIADSVDDDDTYTVPQSLPPMYGGFQQSSTYTSPPPRNPTTAAPAGAHLGSNANRSNPQLRQPPPVPSMLPPIGYQPTTKTKTSSQNSLSGLDREDSYVSANRQAAARYLGSSQPHSPAVHQQNPVYNSNNNRPHKPTVI